MSDYPYIYLTIGIMTLCYIGSMVYILKALYATKEHFVEISNEIGHLDFKLKEHIGSPHISTEEIEKYQEELKELKKEYKEEYKQIVERCVYDRTNFYDYKKELRDLVDSRRQAFIDDLEAEAHNKFIALAGRFNNVEACFISLEKKVKDLSKQIKRKKS